MCRGIARSRPDKGIIKSQLDLAAGLLLSSWP